MIANQPASVFFSYSHRDEKLRDRLTAWLETERGRIDDHPTDVLEALFDYTRGRQLMEQRNGPAVERAVTEFKKAVGRDGVHT